MRSVLIPYKYVPEYRRPFFAQLRERAWPDFDIRVSAGEPVGEQAEKSDSAVEDWYYRHRVKPVEIFKKRILWQEGVLEQARGADAVIVEQANALLVNQLLLVTRPKSLAFWGHGFDHQRPASGLNEAVKRKQLKRPGWWFAYTDATREYLARAGVPRTKITVVQNAIDTTELAEATSHFPSIIRPSAALYIGSLYAEKRLDLTLEIADLIAESLPNFSLTIAGDGPLRSYIIDQAETRTWLHYEGRLTSTDRKVELASECAVLLNLGLVGLVAVESFGLATPIVTTNAANHSPEFDYLRDGENSVILRGDQTAPELAAQIVRILTDPKFLAQLTRGCIESAETFTLEAMVENFLEGIEAWFSSSV